MWITQSYLATVEPDAKVFIYCMFEEYNDQMDFTQGVQFHLERMGEVHGGDVSLLMPNPRYADRIEAEMREIRPLWELVYSSLPALIISTEPMKNLSGSTEKCVCIPFKGLSEEEVAETISEVRRITYETLLHAHKQPVIRDRESPLERIGDSIEIKPGIFGVSIDLKRLFWK